MTRNWNSSASLRDIEQKTADYVLDLAKRAPLNFIGASGCYLYDDQGRRYLDFLCGVAVTSLGHCHPDIIAVIEEQSQKLMHLSNLFYNEEQAELAKLLITKSFPGKVFFVNSGTEANEAAFKLARAYGQEHKRGAAKILSLYNSFHGRTTASMCLTGQEKIHQGFGPLLSDHLYIKPNDSEGLEAVFNKYGSELCAFFIELIQGEGGIFPLSLEYVQLARKLCEEQNVLFVIDEVQTGIGRTGKLFCYEHYNVSPDVMTLAKALGGGLPTGAVIVGQKYSSVLKPGQHGSTMGGNFLACKVAKENLEIIARDKLLDNVCELSLHIIEQLTAMQKKYNLIEGEIRGLGFHIGMTLNKKKLSAADFVNSCRDKGLIINAATANTIRIMPPLNINKDQLDEGLQILDAALADSA